MRFDWAVTPVFPLSPERSYNNTSVLKHVNIIITILPKLENKNSDGGKHPLASIRIQ
jgi:hypothetical protein